MNIPPLGVTLRGDGADVAVFSTAASAIEICLFDDQDLETGRHVLAERSGDVFHGHVPGLIAGTRYGLRASGRFAPEAGHRFNPNKLLLDPHATRIDRVFRLHPSQFDTQQTPSDTDSAAFMPKAIAMPPPAAAPPPPAADWARLVIYELHVRGFSALNPAVPEGLRGTFAGLAHPASIEYLQRLGVTAVEILPSAAWIDERHLPPLGLRNYWGYNPVSFCAPDPRLAPGGFAEIADAVAALRRAGMATILDVVFNHSGESDAMGPTLSLRGLDNAYYYRLQPDRRHYVNDAGCGNVLAAERPGVVRLVLDALLLWARATGADGFRFDLATTLGRSEAGFDAAAPLLTAIAQDPVLRDLILIAEPWDVGPGGYQLGKFASPWAEWNDRYRDTVRKFWRGDAGRIGDMATRLAGSSDIFASSRRPPSRGVNYITAHDGFTLRDLVSYTHKQNDANGEQNRDGTDGNLSWNHGIEGATDDARVLAARARDMRALLATLLFSRGTPMLTMGDEAGRTQGGNNNAYAQDNEISWLDWNHIDPELLAFTRQAIELRLATLALHDDRWLTGGPPEDPDVAWLAANGAPMTPRDWQESGANLLMAVLRTPSMRALVVLHAGCAAREVVLPPPRAGHVWRLALDSAAPARETEPASGIEIAARSVVLLLEHRQAGTAPALEPGALRHLAAASGLALHWWDVAGVRHEVAPATLAALLAAQGLPAASRAQARDSLARLAERRDRQALPPALVVPAGQAGTLRLGPGCGGRERWLKIEPEEGGEPAVRRRIAPDDGQSFAAEAADGRRATARRIDLPAMKMGRYRVMLEGVDAATRLTVAPTQCFLPASLANGERRFGIAGHLYTLRHANDQGVGDFTALAELATVAGGQGASALGLNPLHALFRSNPERASPYHPSERRCLNPIYIDVTQLGRLGQAPMVRAALDAEQGALCALREQRAVNYTEVWRVKQRVLRAAFDALAADTDTDAALDLFLQAGGASLRDFTIWEVLAERFGVDWHRWPEPLRRPDSGAVAAFARENATSLRFSGFLQMLAESGLAQAAVVARQAGLDIGLYRDLAVGCAPDGAEAWSGQSLLLRGASIGAPPDPLGPQGQVWHLPPPNPLAMAENGYLAFADLLACNMRHAGALRIDHVMGLRRLFLVPDGGDARDGTYLEYPFQDLLGQVALESHRARCLVVGEDLGTVPQDMGVALAEKSLLSYRVLWFEQAGGHFRPPSAWPPIAAACVSTHDLPTFLGWWQGVDIAELQALGLLSEADAAAFRTTREDTRRALMAALRDAGLAGEDPPLAAVHALIGRTPCLLALVQADDLAGELVGVNLPGTDTERPNWRRRLGSDALAFRDHPVLAAIRQERKNVLF